MSDLKSKSRPFGYWKDEENVKREFLPFCEREGFLPSRKYFEEIDRKDLVAACSNIGQKKLSFILGYKISAEFNNQKPNGYWQNEENIKKEFLPFCEKEGYLPSKNYFTKIGRPDLTGAHSKIGTTKISLIVGYKSYREFNNIKPDGYWNNEENIKKEFLQFCQKEGYLPSQGYFSRIKREDLAKAHGRIGPNKISEIVGYEPYQKFYRQNPDNFWNSDKIKKILVEFNNKNNRFPDKNELNFIERGLAAAVDSYGGYKKIFENEKIDFKNRKCRYIKTDFCEEVCLLRSEFEVFTHSFLIFNNIKHFTNGKLLNSNFRYDFKLTDFDLYIEIWGYRDAEVFKDYQSRRKIKEKFYSQNNFKLTSIEGVISTHTLERKYNYLKNFFQKDFEIKEFDRDKFFKFYDFYPKNKL